jgi:hypothetical protein
LKVLLDECLRGRLTGHDAFTVTYMGGHGEAAARE